jgi:hypothetical protein
MPHLDHDDDAGTPAPATDAHTASPSAALATPEMPVGALPDDALAVRDAIAAADPTSGHGAGSHTLTTTAHTDSQITVRPEPDATTPVIFLRLDARWTHTIAATYLDTAEARAFAAALTHAADHLTPGAPTPTTPGDDA